MTVSILSTQFILYVEDQETSCRFYEALFRCKPSLHVPGMSEFLLSPSCKLGLMPNNNIAKILSGKTKHPATGTGIPRCELYLNVPDVQSEYENAITVGTTVISKPEPRDWGDKVFYISDPDGHIIAFAETLVQSS